MKMKKIAIIFDTNIFGKPNDYVFNSGTIVNFLEGIKLSKNIDVYLPSIVVSEIEKHIKDSINEDKISKKSGYFKKSIKSDFYDKLIEDNINKFDDFIKKYRIKILDCSNYMNIDDVNSWYFNKEEPFEISKPKEFPDAMIISAIINFLNKGNYDENYIISYDNGFAKGIETHSTYTVYKNIGDVTRCIYHYTNDFETKINNYIIQKEILGSDDSLYVTSSSDDDLIEYDIGGYEYGRIDIINVTEKTIEISINFTIGLNGEFLVIDPYESTYDKEDPDCSSYVYKTTNNVVLKNLINEVSLYLDDSNNIINYKITKGALVDLTDYLDQMDYCYD